MAPSSVLCPHIFTAFLDHKFRCAAKEEQFILSSLNYVEVGYPASLKLRQAPWSNPLNRCVNNLRLRRILNARAKQASLVNTSKELKYTMRLFWSLSAILVASSSVEAFAPSNNAAVLSRSILLRSTVVSSDVKAKQDATLEKLRAKDRSSSTISKDVSVPPLSRSGDVFEETVNGDYLYLLRHWSTPCSLLVAVAMLRGNGSPSYFEITANGLMA